MRDSVYVVIILALLALIYAGLEDGTKQDRLLKECQKTLEKGEKP